MDLPGSTYISQALRLFIFMLILFQHEVNGKDESDGYYEFVKASPAYMKPPKVRKPPYMRTNSLCPSGGGGPTWRPAPKYTLCGDLNKGYIPMNPLGQDFSGEPYPFDLIKNKTLTFFSKTLPYLKTDPNLPKVAKYETKLSPVQRPNLSMYHKKPLYHQRFRRETKTNSTSTTTPTPTSETNASSAENEVLEKRSRFLDQLIATASTGRQSCDQGGAAGLLCTFQSVMSNFKDHMVLLNTVAQGVSALSGVASSSSGSSSGNSYSQSSQSSNSPSDSQHTESNSGGSMAEMVIGLLGSLAHLGLAGSTKNDGYAFSNSDSEQEPPSSLAHVMSVLTGASPGNPSALSLVLKLLASEASPLKAIVGGFQKRRPSSSDELLTAESSVRRPQEADYELPPTPCTSNEEYVTPTFARNYQGVWKYVVQIPQEGYFTQTVQQTKCIKNRCDFMDGVCHESPRWVSLLVAETFYPDTSFPTVAPTSPDNQAPPPVEDFYNFQQYLKRRVGQDDTETSNYRTQNYKKDTTVDQQHCDGHDHIGCYVVRLYYDWFLVNGSCKCWKPSPKRILTGR